MSIFGTKYDAANFTATQAGPGGAGVLGLGEVGGGTPQAAGTLQAGTQVSAAPGSKTFSIAPVIWMFLFLLIGYWGLHQALKAV